MFFSVPRSAHSSFSAPQDISAPPEPQTMMSREADLNRPTKDRTGTSPVRCAWTRCSRATGSLSRVSGGLVTFEPVRPLGHGTSHPVGQVPDRDPPGLGLGGRNASGGPVEEMRPGDVVWIAPGAEALARRDGDHAR